MIKLVGFDLDGTILDSLPDLADAVNFGLRKEGLPERSTDEICSFIGDGVFLLIERAAAPVTDSACHKRIKAGFDEYYGTHFYHRSKIYEGMAELLEKLQKTGVSIAVLSNKPDSFVKMILEKLFPDFPFAAVMGQSEQFPKKPDPTAFRYLQKQVGSLPEQSVFVGDSDVDLQTAKNAGAIAVGVTWGYRERALLEQTGGDYLADTPKQLETFLLKESCDIG